MALSTGTIPNLVNGVSRQPDAIRLPSQVQEQINGFSTVVEGLQNRPGTKHHGTLSSFTGSLFAHGINRDANERYFVAVQDGDLKVFDLGGTERIVAFPDGKTYLDCSLPAMEAFSAATSADYTFIVNKEVTVNYDNASAVAARDPEALVYVRAVNFSKRYKILIDGVVVADYRTNDGASDNQGGAARDAAVVTPQNIAKIFLWGLGDAAVTYPAWGTPDGVADALNDDNNSNAESRATIYDRLVDNLDPAVWGVTVYLSTLHIWNKNGDDFELKVECDTDAQNRPALVIVKDEIRDFADLPSQGPSGFKVRVSNFERRDEDDYYVEGTKASGDVGDEVIWKECVAAGARTAFDTSTMPHVLVRESDGTFTFRQATEWAERKCGDEELDPGPSFIDRSVSGVFFGKGRLGFLSGENVIMTRSGEFFDFWRTTMTVLLDDDPIDIAANEGPISDNDHAIVWNRNVVLLAEQALQVLSGQRLMTPKSVSIDLAFEEPILSTVKPCRSTRTMFIASNSASYGDIREVFIGDDPDNQTIGTVSDHVPDYIPADMVQMVSSPTKNTLAVRAESAPNKLFIYQWFWSGQEKLQSAWHTWVFDSGDEVVGMEFFDDDLFMLVRRSGTLYIDSVCLASKVIEDNRKWGIRLDRRTFLGTGEGVYNAVADETVFTLPYTIGGSTDFRVATYGGTRHGVPATIKSYGSNTITVDGDWSATDVAVGRAFSCEIDLSQQYFRVAGNGQMKSLEANRLQVLRHVYGVNATTYFRVEVTAYTGANPRIVEYSTLTGGDADSLLGEVTLLNKALRVPINAKACRLQVKIVNDTYYPMALNGIEWEGFYQPRARTVA